MGQINKIPLGFLNMLGSQTGGKNPFEVSETVIPTVDMIPFYHAQALRVVDLETPAPVRGTVMAIEVPADESWFVYTMSAQQASLNVLDRVSWAFGIGRVPKGGTGSEAFTNFEQTPLLAPAVVFDAMIAGVILPVPLPVTGGSRLTATVISQVNSRLTNFEVLIASFTS